MLIKKQGEISPHACQNGYYQKVKQWQALRGYRLKRNPNALLVGLSIAAASMENSTEVPQKLKYYMIQQFFWVFNPKKTKNTNLEKKMQPPCLLQHFLP